MTAPTPVSGATVSLNRSGSQPCQARRYTCESNAERPPEIEARRPHRIAPIGKQPTESDRHAQPRDLLTWTLRLYLKYLVRLRAGLSESETAFLDRIAGDDDGFGGGRHPGCPPGLLGAYKRLGVQRSLMPSAWPTLDRRDGQSD